MTSSELTLTRDTDRPKTGLAARAVGAVKTYGVGDVSVRALDGVDADIPSGAFSVIMGPSGSGRSTLVQCLAGLDTLTKGEIELGGQRLSGMSDKQLTILRRDHVGFVFQSFNLIPTLTALENITLPAEGAVGGYAQLVDLDGEPLTTTGAPFLGVSWGREDALRPATLDTGRAPDGLGEVAIDRGTAEDYDFAVGDRTTVLLADGSQPEVEIVGIFTFGEANNLLGARLIAFDIDVASQVLGAEGDVDSVDVIAEPGVEPEDLARRIQAQLPDGIESVTGAQVQDEGGQSVDGLMNTFQNILLGFAAIALFVSAFFINNTFSIVVGQRIRQLALLRSLGASRSQITASVVVEALVVGVLASALGIGFGLLIAIGLQALLQAAGFGLPDQGLILAPRTLVAAVVVGVGVTLVACLAPARRASTVAPVEGMREGYVLPAARRLRRSVLGGSLVVTGAALVAIGLFVAEATPCAIPTARPRRRLPS